MPRATQSVPDMPDDYHNDEITHNLGEIGHVRENQEGFGRASSRSTEMYNSLAVTSIHHIQSLEEMLRGVKRDGRMGLNGRGHTKPQEIACIV